MIANYKEILVFLLLAHVLGDFYFQHGYSSYEKEKKFRCVVIHSFIYGFTLFALTRLVVSNFNNTYLYIIISFHFVINTIKFYGMKKEFMAKRKNPVFCVDQITHLIVIMTIAFYVMKSDSVYEYTLEVREVLNVMNLSIETVLAVLLKALLIHKPINVFIVSIMKTYKPQEKTDDGILTAGRTIGTLERIIMLVFLSIHQYSSIGLVLTAKSIARYNKITEHQEFAEYYLLGTLLSTISVLVVSFI